MSESRVETTGGGTAATTTYYGPWSACKNGQHTRNVIHADGTVTEETASCTDTGTGTTKAFAGGGATHPPSTFPWGTVLLIGGVLAAGGAAVWEIEAHRQNRAIKG